MQKWLLILCLLFSQMAFAQRGLLYVKKKGIKKVRTFAEGDAIYFKTKDRQTVRGVLALVKSDSLYINGHWYRSGNISSIILREKGGLAEPLLLTTAGVLLSSAGMTLAKWGTFPEALGWSAGIGYGNIIIRILPKQLKRKKYKIGGKFSVQTLDLHF
jgi:hypothetical protein